ncbi:hypothetical protein FQN60_009234 [Etheostoma spectabile]|uniref:Uncharacterized protein n=1 Tax=Etheostoma spectabile TaxID=54343 RepID=A0A5J5CAH1_9PERO|nr:hypothetical protein FQN60_009234 [Etheostoma spectabile]
MSHMHRESCGVQGIKIRRHYSTRHAEDYTKYQEMRERTGRQLKKCLLRQQDLFKEANKEKKAAVEASYVVSEMIAKAGKPFQGSKFIKRGLLE